MTKEFWNERYTQHACVYGQSPNEFFKEQLQLMTPGKILLPAEGEGRNAIYAATLGWQVTAFDFSEVARSKTMERAAALGITSVHYSVEDIERVILPENEFDAVALIYVHQPVVARQRLHRHCMQSLKPGGKLILEAFSKDQLRYNTGGPKDLAMLYSCMELEKDFSEMEIIRCEELLTHLDEGPFHSGTSAIVRLVAVN